MDPGPRNPRILAKPRLVRFRILDPRHALGGLTDLTVPVAQFASLCPAWRHVFVTENEINGLAFPPVPDAAVVFGLGYGIDRLGEAPWLGDRALHYWGDIDTHGFAMLDRLRAHFPHATFSIRILRLLRIFRLMLAWRS